MNLEDNSSVFRMNAAHLARGLFAVFADSQEPEWDVLREEPQVEMPVLLLIGAREIARRMHIGSGFQEITSFLRKLLFRARTNARDLASAVSVDEEFLEELTNCGSILSLGKILSNVKEVANLQYALNIHYRDLERAVRATTFQEGSERLLYSTPGQGMETGAGEAAGEFEPYPAAQVVESALVSLKGYLKERDEFDHLV